MFATSFGAPVPGGGSPAQDTTKTNGALNEEPVQLLDENDPRLTSEEISVDVTKDAYAVRPLPPDRKWRAKLQLVQMENANKEKKDYLPASVGKDNSPCFQATVQATILGPDERFEGFKVSPRFGGTVNTLPRRDGSSQVGTILSKLRKPDGTPWAPANARMSHSAWITLLVRALAGEPECGVETNWEASCPECGKEAKAKGEGYPPSIVGMQKFPAEQDKVKRSNGEMFSPEIKCQRNAGHGYFRAYPKIVRFLSLDELKTSA